MGQSSDSSGRQDGESLTERAERLLGEGMASSALALLEDARPARPPADYPFIDRLIVRALLDLGRHGEAYTTLQAALANPAIDGDDRAQVLLLDVLGNVHHAAGHFQAAAEVFGRALYHAERLDPPDHALRARLHVNLGSTALKSGQVEAATIYYERAVEAARQAHDLRRLGMAYMGLGFARQQARDYGAALAHTGEAMRLFERAGDARQMMQARTNLALIYAEQGDWEAAVPHLQEVLGQARADGDAGGIAHALELLARAGASRGDHARAAELAAEARVTAERSGDGLEAHLAGVTEASALVVLGQDAAAEELYRRAIAYFREAGATRHLMSASQGYAAALRGWGRSDEALEVLDAAYTALMDLRQG